MGDPIASKNAGEAAMPLAAHTAQSQPPPPASAFPRITNGLASGNADPATSSATLAFRRVANTTASAQALSIQSDAGSQHNETTWNGQVAGDAVDPAPKQHSTRKKQARPAHAKRASGWDNFWSRFLPRREAKP